MGSGELAVVEPTPANTSQHLAASQHMMGEAGEAGEADGHRGLYHTSSQVLLARLWDNVLTNLHPPPLRQACLNCGQLEGAVGDITDTRKEGIITKL